MANDQQQKNHPQVDNTVIAAFFVNGKPLAISCLVTSEAPLFLFTKDPRITGLSYPQTVILVWHRGSDVVKGEATVVGIKPFKTGYSLELKQTDWKEVDRRVYPRHTVRLPVSLRAVQDVRGSTIFTVFQGETVDISLGGALVVLDQPIPRGSLIEFNTTLPNGESLKAFAMVAQLNKAKGGIGIEFLDFMGPMREKLESFFAQAA